MKIIHRAVWTAVSIFAFAGCTLDDDEPTELATEGLTQPTTIYNLTGRTSPAAAATAVHIDARLTLTFDAAPAVAAAGTVQILRKSDDALIDTIHLGRETDAIGFPGQDRVRIVNVDRLITVSGSTVTIVPHHAKLAYNTAYYVNIASGVFTGVALGGTPFTGIGKAGNWSFTTGASPSTSATSLVVDDDGTADFRTVQGAIDHLTKNVAKATAVTINVRNGNYPELLFIRGKNNLSIVGESKNGVIIQYRNYEGLNTGSGQGQVAGSTTPTGGRPVVLAESVDLLTLSNLTLRNTMLRSTTVSSQAEAIYFNNDAGRFVAKSVNVLSEQDTVELRGYAWFFGSLVAGNVDFIWGSNRVALFENSEIRSLGDTAIPSSGGFIVQARTVSAADKGFVFLNSKLTHGPGPGPRAGDVPTGGGAATYLARSPGSTSSFDNVAFINCQMDTHIIPRGWAYNTAGQPVSNPATATAASGWREHGTTNLSGAALNLSARVGGHLLTDSEVASGFATRAKIFAAFGGGAGWNPTP